MAASLKSKMAAIKVLKSRVYRSFLNKLYGSLKLCAKFQTFITFWTISVKIGPYLLYYSWRMCSVLCRMWNLTASIPDHFLSSRTECAIFVSCKVSFACGGYISTDAITFFLYLHAVLSYIFKFTYFKHLAIDIKTTSLVHKNFKLTIFQTI